MSIAPYITPNGASVDAWTAPFYVSPDTTDYQANRDAAHAAADYLLSEHGGGVVKLPAGVIGVSAALVGRDHTIYDGAGMFTTVVRRMVDVAAAVGGLTRTKFSGFRNLCLDGNFIGYGADGVFGAAGVLTTGQHGIAMSTIPYELSPGVPNPAYDPEIEGTKYSIIENVLIARCRSYGIGFQDAGPYIDNYVHNLIIQDVGSDGIDFKNDGLLNRDNTIDNILIERFSQAADGVTQRAGIDCRGMGFQLKSIRVDDFGRDITGVTNGANGVRFRITAEGFPPGNGYGGEKSTLSGFYIVGQDRTALGGCGIEIGSDNDVSVNSGTILNLDRGIRFQKAGHNIFRHSVSQIHCDNVENAYVVSDGSDYCTLTDTDANNCGIAYDIDGDGTTLVNPGVFNCSLAFNLTATQSDTKVFNPRTSGNVRDWAISGGLPIIWDKGDQLGLGVKPVVAVSETIPRALLGGDSVTLISGRERCTPIPLLGGTVLTKLSFVSQATAGVGIANQWFTLRDINGNLLFQTQDGLAAAWAALTFKTLNVGTDAVGAPIANYMVPSTGWYLVGIMVNAATVPNLAGIGTPNAINGVAPVQAGYTGSVGLTTTAPITAAIASNAGRPYCIARSD